MASASVPWPVAGASVERGKNSYHALNRARTGSTSTSTGLASSAVGLADAGAPEQRLEVEARRAPARRRRGPGCGRRRAGTSADGRWPSGRVSPAARRWRSSVRAWRVGAASPAGERRRREADADLQVDGDVDAGVELELHAVAPRAEVVEPADDLVLPAAEPVGHERGREAVVAERRHRDLPPALARRSATAQRGGGAVVAVGEHVGEHGDRFADRRLGRERPPSTSGDDGFDDDTTRARARQGGRGRGRHRWEP